MPRVRTWVGLTVCVSDCCCLSNRPAGHKVFFMCYARQGEGRAVSAWVHVWTLVMDYGAWLGVLLHRDG